MSNPAPAPAYVDRSPRYKVRRLLDIADHGLCKLGLAKTAAWSAVREGRVTKLYAGRLSRVDLQFRDYYGITPFFPSSRNIFHDVRQPLPIPDNSVTAFQSEDVFEHLPLADIVPILNEIHRVLRPGALLRLSLPDYGWPGYALRTLRDAEGRFLFDPGGGGSYEDGKVVGGGHIWFPTLELVEDLMSRSSFGKRGEIRFRQFNRPDGTWQADELEAFDGPVRRTPQSDSRVGKDGPPPSIVVDARKT